MLDSTTNRPVCSRVMVVVAVVVVAVVLQQVVMMTGVMRAAQLAASDAMTPSNCVYMLSDDTLLDRK